MLLDVLGLLSACSYALDCVEAELVHVSDKHAKRVAYMSVCMAEQLGISDESLQDLAACALLHDNALTQYIQEELHKDVTNVPQASQVGIHCTLGEKNIQRLPFHTDVKNVILYHHENANGSGPCGKTWEEVPIFSRIIHLSDLLDRAYGAKGFTEDTFNKACGYLHKNEGTIVDKECVDAFLQAFPLPHFLTLGEDSFEKNLWEKIPRIKQELSFAQIKELASFFAQIVDYKSPFTSTHSIGVAEDAERLSRYMGFDEETVQKMYLAGTLHDIGKVPDEEPELPHALLGMKLAEKYKEKIVVISLSVDPEAVWKETEVNESADNWLQLSDGLGMSGIAAHYGVHALPSFIYISPESTVLKAGQGYKFLSEDIRTFIKDK